MTFVDIATLSVNGVTLPSQLTPPAPPPPDARGHAYPAPDEFARCAWCGTMRNAVGRDLCTGNVAWRDAEAARMWTITKDLSCE